MECRDRVLAHLEGDETKAALADARNVDSVSVIIGSHIHVTGADINASVDVIGVPLPAPRA